MEAAQSHSFSAALHCMMLIVRDNEKPARLVHVHGFQAQGRPITNEEVQLTVTCKLYSISTDTIAPLVRDIHLQQQD